MRVGFNSLSLVLIVVAFVFLLLATISTPVVRSFSLATTDTHQYGIFGYCYSAKDTCTKASYPYSISAAHDATSNWLLATSTRNTLSKVFIVAPIALGLNFITLAVIVATHFGKAIALFAIVLNIISFAATTIVGIIVVLVFYPNVDWTGWILIGAAGANFLSLIALFLSLTFNNDSSDDIASSESLDRYVTQVDSEKQGFGSSFGGPRPLNNIPPPNPTNYDTSSSFSKDFESKESHPYTRNQPSNFQLTPHQPRNPYGPKPLSQPQVFQQSYENVPQSSNSSVYNDAAQTANDFTNPTNHYQPSASSYYDNNSVRNPIESKINIVDTLHTPILVKRELAPNLVASSAGIQQPPNLSYPTNHIRDSEIEPVYPLNHSSVFEHHPEVEGHKPFTELDDFDLDDYADDERVPLNSNHPGHNPGSSGHESDADSDFTSVSQRAPNPKYGAQSQAPQGYYPVSNQPMHQQAYPQPQPYLQNQPFVQQQPQQYYVAPPPQNTAYGGFQPQPQLQIQPQVRQAPKPTISDNALANNPDFNLGSTGPGKRKVQPGFVPVANRYNKSAAASSLMGRGAASSRSGPYGVI